MFAFPLESGVFLSELSQLFGYVTDSKLGMNLAQYVTIPRKLLTSPTDVGGRASCIALTFVGSGETSFAEKTSPKKVSESL